MLEALAQLRASGEIDDETVQCEFYGERLNALTPLARNPAYSPFVQLMGHVVRDQALEHQRNADLLLLLETSQTRGIVPAKVYEYLSSGSPILSIGSDRDSAVARLLQYTGGGCCLERDVEAIKALLRQMLGGETPDWFRPKVERILEFSRERRADLMFEMITEQCSQGR